MCGVGLKRGKSGSDIQKGTYAIESKTPTPLATSLNSVFHYREPISQRNIFHMLRLMEAPRDLMCSFERCCVWSGGKPSVCSEIT